MGRRITSNERVARHLDAAADLLETKGWCRGLFADNQGRHCLAGALQSVGHHPSAYRGATDALVDTLRTQGEKGAWITDWNDRQKDKRKVIRLLRTTSKRLRS